MINNYLTEREKRKNIDNIFYNYLFGIELGMLLILIGVFNFFKYTGNIALDIILMILFFIGTIIFFIAIFSPLKLEKIRSFMFFWGNKIFELVLKILLIILYYLILSPSNLLRKKKKSGVEIDSNYTNMNEKMYANVKGIRAILKFINKDTLYMLPFILICIILGLFFAFINSSVVAPFIYTLF